MLYLLLSWFISEPHSLFNFLVMYYLGYERLPIIDPTQLFPSILFSVSTFTCQSSVISSSNRMVVTLVIFLLLIYLFNGIHMRVYFFDLVDQDHMVIFDGLLDFLNSYLDGRDANVDHFVSCFITLHYGSSFQLQNEGFNRISGQLFVAEQHYGPLLLILPVGDDV